jgi:hypothetical protein
VHLWAFSSMKTPLHAPPGILSNRKNALGSTIKLEIISTPGAPYLAASSPDVGFRRLSQ